MVERPAFAATSHSPNVVFYYGHEDRTDLLTRFDVAVVEPGHGFQPDAQTSRRTQWLAYLSMGEVLSTRSYFQYMPEDWLLGMNQDWNAHIIDQSAKAWSEFLVEQIARPLWERGYQGFFLDTMDSWRLLEGSEAELEAQRSGLAQAVMSLRRAFPQAVIVMNRGFELLDDVHADVDALMFESLYGGWDQAGQGYIEVPAAERGWLLDKAAAAQDYQLPVIALDYCPPGQHDRARSIVQRIQHHGIVPSIADGHLHAVNTAILRAPQASIVQASDATHRAAADPLGYETALHTVAVPGVPDLVIRSLLDRQQYHDPDGEAQRLGISPALWPLFGLLWPSSVRMAAHLAQRTVHPTEKILEIGCGLALPSLVAHGRGADVTASDRHPLAATFLQENLRLNRLPSSLKYRHGQWGRDERLIREPDDHEALSGRYDLIIGSDLLYERDVAPVLARFIGRHARPTAEAWIVDANRGYRPLFSRYMAVYGFELIESLNLTPDNGHHQPSPYKGKLLKYRR